MTRLIFRNANLLDGDHPARPGSTVVVEGERIASVGSAPRRARRRAIAWSICAGAR